MSDKWNEKKYDFGDMENAFEMGINFAVLNEKSIAKDGVDHLDAIHEAVEGSSGRRNAVTNATGASSSASVATTVVSPKHSAQSR